MVSCFPGRTSIGPRSAKYGFVADSESSRLKHILLPLIYLRCLASVGTAVRKFNFSVWLRAFHHSRRTAIVSSFPHHTPRIRRCKWRWAIYSHCDNLLYYLLHGKYHQHPLLGHIQSIYVIPGPPGRGRLTRFWNRATDPV
jgi:hypothetical protein